MNSPVWRWVGMLLLAVVLAVIFSAYLRPDFVAGLANRIIMCF
jgi:hypothetical protein